MYRKVLLYLKEYGVKKTGKKVIRFLAQSIEYQKWIKKHDLTKIELDSQSKVKFPMEHKISIVVPLYRTPEKYLIEFIESVEAQTYANWELCLSDGSGSNSSLTSILKEFERKDKRIRVVYNNKALRIADNTNSAISIATGEYIGFADHDDLLAPDLLFECVKALNSHSDIDAIYTDEDKVDMKGHFYFQPHFKPNFNIDLLRSTNYFCHFFMVKREILEKVGNINSDYDGAQDYDFVLRCVEETKKIYHIPKILYHWRAHMGSTAVNPNSKNYAFEAGARALKAHLDRMGWDNTEVVNTECRGIYRTVYYLKENPLVSIVISNVTTIDGIRRCLSSVEKQLYRNYEIIIVGSRKIIRNDKEISAFSRDRIQIIECNEEAPRSVMVNLGVKKSTGKYILLLDANTEMLHERCIEALLAPCLRNDIGVVGSRIYSPKWKVFHAGIVIGLKGVAGYLFSGLARDDTGYFARIITSQNYTAVSSVCCMMDRQLFDGVGGFDEGYQLYFDDVDFCLKVRDEGYLVLYNPYVEVCQFVDKKRKQGDFKRIELHFKHDELAFRSKWKRQIDEGDMYYNVNFSINKTNCSLR